MRPIEVHKDRATVELSIEELIIINNALNEVCHGIEVPEFRTRVGAEIDEVRALLDQFGDTIDQVTGNQQ